MKISPTTWALGLAALGSVLLVTFDPWTDDGGGGFVSTRSAAKRVFQRAADVSPEAVEITVAPAAGEETRLVPSADGHAVVVDGKTIGPADPEAVEGLWASLRMATTLRAVAGEVDMGPARKGELTIAFGDEQYGVIVGAPTPDGVGLYGAIGDEVWVVEDELGLILDQKPEAWLARRAVVVEPGQVTRVAFSDATLTRGKDGLWRSGGILNTDSVEARIDRLVSARLDPMLPDADAPGEPWATVDAVGDRRWTLRRGGPCPGTSDREVLRRGEGWAGCIDAAVTEPWNVAKMLEPRLLPHAHARVLRIEMAAPARRTLSRKAGDWTLQEAEGRSDVQGAEVFRWYTALHDAEVELHTEVVSDWDVDLRLVTDSTVELRLRCRTGDPVVCRRDDGPTLKVRTDDVALVFDRDTFVARQLAPFSTEDARAIEITGEGRQRQSVHFDMGVWRLDAPGHPDGDDALSEIRLEDLLAAVAGARAEAWVGMPSGAPLRTIRVELTPTRDRDSEVVVALHEGCVAVVGERAGQLSESVCRRLGRDLLHDDAVKYWIETARAIEVREGGTTTKFRREEEALVSDDDDAEARARLDTLSAMRSVALVSGDPPGAALGTLRVLPAKGAAFEVQYAEAWAQIDGVGWFYRLETPEP